MRLLVVIALLVSLAACGSADGGVARDPAATSTEPPTAPVPDGLVRTAGAVMVMDTGRPELCLGPIAESWPPQCGGPPISGWDWAAHEGSFEQQGDTRWGEFGLTGRWDGTTFEVTDAVPAERYDASPVPPVQDDPAPGLDESRLSAIAERLRHEVVGAWDVTPLAGRVHLGVTYDDGSLQEWADEEFGAGTVVVVPALADAG